MIKQRIIHRCRARWLSMQLNWRLAARDDGGQVLVLGLIVAIALVMVSVSVANVGIMVAEKIRLQDTADASAYSAAVAQARYMNLSAYLNRAIVANYDAMAFNTSLWATTDAFDHGLAVTAGILYLLAGVLQFIPVINAAAPAVDGFGAAIDAIHNPMHVINQQFDDLFAQDDDDLNQYIEYYNANILSLYQGLLYTAMQSSRYQIIQDVAHKMDKEVMTTTVLGLGAESLSADELAQTVDYVIDKPDKRDQPYKELSKIFNDIAGEDDNTDDHIYLLGAVTEASLDKFSAGRLRTGDQDVLRNFNLGNVLGAFLGGWKDFIDGVLTAECYAECIGLFGWIDGCDCDSDVGMTIGAAQRWGQEDKASQTRVPIIARQRMREVNFFGIDFNFEGLMSAVVPSPWGHTSAERHNDVANVKNLYELDLDRSLQCMLAGCRLNDPNIKLSLLTGSELGILSDDDSFFDDHWDGSYDPQPVCGLRWYNFQALSCIDEVIDYISELFDQGFEQGVPKYDWKVNLPDVGFPHYIFDESRREERPAGATHVNASRNYIAGPSIAVVAVKRAEDVNGLRGLGIGNDYPVTAVSRSQVYYLYNPNRENEKASLFNPHWVARLAPIDSEGSPDFLRDGLPFVASLGVPIKPTH